MTVETLTDLLRGRRVVALTGAGISTESGIPDYRGEGTRARARVPIMAADFSARESTRRMYWARSYLGWPTIAAATPNDGHRALAALEEAGRVLGVITQNVDRLHRAAGSRAVVELHGALAEVVCLECERTSSRDALQDRLARLNPSWRPRAGNPRPDGDRSLSPGDVADFVSAACELCGGALKPDVVFFGGTVPAAVVEAAWALYRDAEVLLVVGTSLAVYSGFRFVRQAARDQRPVAIINRGETRGDPLAHVRVDAAAGQTLTALAHRLVESPSAG